MISREPPFWLSTFYGPGLPAEGVSYRRRTHAEVLRAACRHYPDELRGSGVTAPEYDLGTDIAVKHGAYLTAYVHKLSAATRYGFAAADITSALLTDQQASLSDVAGILHHSYWRVSRLQAERPQDTTRLHSYLRWIRPTRAERWAARSVRAAWTLGRQARIIAADVVGEARRVSEARTGR